MDKRVKIFSWLLMYFASIFLLSNNASAAPNPVANLTSTSHTVNVLSNKRIISVQWTRATTNDVGRSVTGYYIFWDTSATTAPGLNNTFQPVTITQLDSPSRPDGLNHYFHIRTIDNQGDFSTALHLGPFVIDGTAPGAPSGFTAAAGNAGVDLSWTTPADSDFKGVMIRVRTDGTFPANQNDGTLVVEDTAKGRSSSASFAHTNLTNGTTYRYSAFAFDNAGNFSVAAQKSAAPAASSVTVTNVNPSSGFNNTTTNIAITGTGFASGAGVKIGTTNATNVSVTNSTSLTATVPSGITAETYDVTVTNPDQSSGTKAGAFTVNNPTATTIAKTLGDNQTGTAGAELANDFVVTVTDASGNPVSGVTVTWAVTQGGGSLSASTTTTGTNGQASTRLTLGPAAGTNTVTATSTGLTGSPITFTATAQAGAANVLSIASGNNQSSTAGTALTNELVVKVTNPSTGAAVSGVTVNFAISTTPTNATGQVLSRSSQVTGTDGQASTRLTLGNKTGTYKVTASSEGLTGSPRTFTAAAAAGSAASFTVEGFSDPVTAGVASSITVTAKDSSGNTATGYTGTAAFSSSDTKAVLPSNYTFQTADSGVKTFSNIVLKTAGEQSITVTDSATSSITGKQDNITVQAASASKIEKISGDGQSGNPGSALSTPFVVTVKDPYDNPVQGTLVTFVVTQGGGSLSVTSGNSNAQGQVSTVLTLGSSPGENKVEARSTGLTGSPATFTATGVQPTTTTTTGGGGGGGGGGGVTAAAETTTTTTTTTTVPETTTTTAITITTTTTTPPVAAPPKQITPPDKVDFREPVPMIEEPSPAGMKPGEEIVRTVETVAKTPGIKLEQKTDGIMEMTLPSLPEGSTLSMIPVGKVEEVSAPPETKIEIDEDKGTIVLTTPGRSIFGVITVGLKIEVSPAPLSFSGFRGTIEKSGVTIEKLEIFPDRMEIKGSGFVASVRPEFMVTKTQEPPGVRLDNQGNLVINYEGGRQQIFYPSIVNWKELKDSIKSGVEKIQVGLDGIIKLTFQGADFRFKPDYFVTTVAPTPAIKFESLDSSTIRITFKDGRQQIVRIL